MHGLDQQVPSFSVDVQYLFGGLALALALENLLTRKPDRGNGMSLWAAASSAALAGGLGANIWVFKAATPGQFDLAMWVRDLFILLAAVVQVPTIAAFSGKAAPKWGVRAFVVLMVARLAVWQSTDLIYAHRTGAEGSPVYGPWLEVFNVPMLLLIVGMVAVMARGWEDRYERRVMLIGVALGVGVMLASLIAGSTPLAELLAGYWIIPWVVSLQVLFTRRVLVVQATARSLADERAAAMTSLARAERRGRLALQSGAMGWFDYDPATQNVIASPELKELLGLAPEGNGLTIGSALSFLHPEDRPRVAEALSQIAGARGTGRAEARWVRPDGETLWIETSAIGSETDEGGHEVVGLVKDVTERKLAEAEKLHQARHDSLTGLPNRAFISDHIGEALNRGGPFSVLLMDLDGFDDISKTLGHSVGDQVLVSVAQRLGTGLRDGDLLARFGGDEFAVSVDGPAERAARIARRLLRLLDEPVEVDGVAISVRANAGIAFAPEDGGDAVTLLRRAESAMYTAKQTQARAHRYRAGDEQDATRRLQLAGRLPTALSSAEFEVYYQPSILLPGGQCEVLEALARWHHPGYGLVPPLEFVPLAEQYGLGFELFGRVLADALAQCAIWRDQGTARCVSVNASAPSVLNPSFLPSVVGALARADVPPEGLWLELTEDVFAGDGSGAAEVLAQLDNVGVRVAIDDFGTGYSSLAYLKQLPLAAIKLDRSLVTGLGTDGFDDAIVSVAINLGHRLGLIVVGEGVETPGELDALRRHGCDAAQGFWICRPGPAEVITDWLASHEAERSRWPRLRAVAGDTTADH